MTRTKSFYDKYSILSPIKAVKSSLAAAALMIGLGLSACHYGPCNTGSPEGGYSEKTEKIEENNATGEFPIRNSKLEAIISQESSMGELLSPKLRNTIDLSSILGFIPKDNNDGGNNDSFDASVDNDGGSNLALDGGYDGGFPDAGEDPTELRFDGKNFCNIIGHPPQDITIPFGTAQGASFTNTTEEAGLPLINSITSSAGDIDNNGFPDVFMVGYDGSLELYMNCNGRFYPLSLNERIIPNITQIPKGTSSAIFDMDKNGLEDLIAGFKGSNIYILFNDGHLTFTPYLWHDNSAPEDAEPTTLVREDFNGDGKNDLYVAMEIDPIRRVIEGGQVQEEDYHTIPNPILMQDPDRTFTDISAEFPEIYDCGNLQTFTAGFINRNHFGLSKLFYIVNDFSLRNPICLFEVGNQNGRMSFTRMPLPLEELLGNLNSPQDIAGMGLDYMFRNNGDLVISVTDQHHENNPRIPTFLIDRNNHVTDITDTINVSLPERTNGFINWGIVYADFNNNMDEEIMTTSGAYFTTMWDITGPQFMRLYANNGDNTYSDATEHAGPELHLGADRYSITTLDYNGDLCLDVLVSPKVVSLSPEIGSADTFDASPTLLKNNCDYPHHRIGLKFSSYGIGATVQADVRQSTVYGQVKATTGLASTGDSSIIIGTILASNIKNLTITCSNGSVTYLENVASEQYLDLTDLCK